MKLKSRIDRLETSRGSQIHARWRPSDIPSDLVAPLVNVLIGDNELSDGEFLELLAKTAQGIQNDRP